MNCLRKKIFNTPKGNTLITVLVALGIASILVAGTMSMLYQLQKETRRLTVKANLIDIQSSIRRMLSDSAKCTFNMNYGSITVNHTSAAALSAHSVDFLSTASLKFGTTPDSETILSLGQIPSLSGTEVTKIKVNNWRSSSATDYLADLVIEISSTSGPIAPLVIANISFTTAGGGLIAEPIVSCSTGLSSSLSSNFSSVVIASDSEPRKINYSNVGTITDRHAVSTYKYQNNSINSIMVTYSKYRTSASGNTYGEAIAFISPDGINWQLVSSAQYGTSSSYDNPSLVFLVPPNWWYRINSGQNNDATLTYKSTPVRFIWTEYR